MKPTNTELLNMSEGEAKLLTGLDRQRRFIMRIQFVKMPCPNCGHKQNVFEAAGIEMDAYDFGVTNHIYHCVSCHRVLEHCVPLTPIGQSWFWHLVPIAPSADIKTIEYRVAGQILQTEPMVFKRLYAVGQPIRMDFKDYEVIGVAVSDGVQKVDLKSCDVCSRCGGIVGKNSRAVGCSCPKALLP